MKLLGNQSYFHVTHDLVTWKPRVELRLSVADLIGLCLVGLYPLKNYWVSGTLSRYEKTLPLLCGLFAGGACAMGIMASTYHLQLENAELKRRLAAERE